MEDIYKTIEARAEGLYKEKGSRFIAFAFPVYTEGEIKTILGELRGKYYDARHHCYAYRLGADKLRFRANDDGEPSSTGGKPILGQIVSHDLTNILIVVVRYFGGIKLGVSGLINAYRTAAADAIGQATIVEKVEEEIIRIKFSYAVLNDVMRVIKEADINVLERNFELECRMILSLRRQGIDAVIRKLQQIESFTLEE
ncbi:IMPACT family protein [Odoribacter lunatus]|uniref:IMPACT family protein n=1 Tax=Odoribacter lunatus TaxID=2941335 RepID=UPI00203C06C4|nr:YigZ family protein [Odoribacter lunatus]